MIVNIAWFQTLWSPLLNGYVYSTPLKANKHYKFTITCSSASLDRTIRSTSLSSSAVRSVMACTCLGTVGAGLFFPLIAALKRGCRLPASKLPASFVQQANRCPYLQDRIIIIIIAYFAIKEEAGLEFKPTCYKIRLMQLSNLEREAVLILSIGNELQLCAFNVISVSKLLQDVAFRMSYPSMGNLSINKRHHHSLMSAMSI